jgi:hypothetical protein
MSAARLRLALAGETMFPPRAPFFKTVKDECRGLSQRIEA